MSKAPKTLTADECQRLLSALRVSAGTDAQILRGLRNHTIACLMLEAGLRVGEVVALQMSDLYFNQIPVINLIVRPEIAKNHEERSVPVSNPLSNALQEYISKHAWLYEQTSDHKVFTLFKSYKNITTRQVRRFIRKAAKRSLGRSVHPHMLRHTFATKAMRVTDMRTVQELLGHSDITSTQIYTHPSADDKKKAIENMHRTDSQ